MKIAIAMSGGVDSSVAAKILKDEGHDLVGLFLKLWSDPACNISRANRCCNYEALEDARRVAAKLKIPFYVIDAKKEFKHEVVDYFLREYQNLRTPNPCIVCNEKIKFDLLLKKALAIGCERLATGHYARISCHPEFISGSQEIPKQVRNDKPYQLLKGIDETKDQSYMLYRLNQDQLSKILFPLGELKKKDVRALATKWDLPVQEKPESQEICFFADRDYRNFLRRYLPAKYFKPGEILDQNGNIIGKHDGLLNYTIGQRKGIEQLQAASCKLLGKDKKPLYVIVFDSKKNQLIVGEDKDVYKKEMIVGNLNWLDSKAKSYQLKANSLSVKIRYRHPEVACEIKKLKNQEIKEPKNKKKIRVIFQKPERAITPGQSAVFYLGDEVIGGGIIEN